MNTFNNIQEVISVGQISANSIVNADCLEAMSYIVDKSIDCILTDLPYGTTACKWDTVIPFDMLWAHYKRVIKPNGAIVLFGSQPFTSALVMSNPKWFKYSWVWEKNLKTGNLNARRMPMGGHEDICVFGSGVLTYNPQKRQRTTEVKAGNKLNSKTLVYGAQREIYIDRQSDTLMPDTIIKGFKCVHNSSGKVHPTQKPVALCEYLIRTSTNEGDTVLDNCMGSGTTGIACLNTGRNFIGIEKDQKYFEIVRNRIEGHNAELSDSRPTTTK
jgi:site-specific DNA-methyltransferase (adenine-specific)